MTSFVNVVEADLSLPRYQSAVVEMTAAYACDAMGNGGPLPDQVLSELISGLRAHPTTIVFLAYANDAPVGIATCFRGFSTFTARPVLNIHDFAVLPAYRGRGVAKRLLDVVHAKAESLGCSKLTLEVQEHNSRARRVYEAAGFSQAVYGETTGGSLFYSKAISQAR